MFFVVPFCAKDEWLALRLMTYCRGLESRQPYNCLVVHDDLISGRAVVEAAREYFAEVKEFTYKHWTGKRDWPYPQNFQFQNAAAHIYRHAPLGREPWFWWEPDATPVKEGWMKALDDRHQEGRRPFAGHIVQGTPFPGRPAMRWMTGCGIYPWDTPVTSPQIMLALQYPWDVASSRDVVPNCTQANDLIQHAWERGGQPFSFADKDDAKAALNSTTVIFHRCKDGSLMDVWADGSWLEKVKRFLEPSTRVVPSDSGTGIVQLGRYGDLVNALPAIRNIAISNGTKPSVIVSKEFADILEGVSYAKPDVFNGTFAQLTEAIAHAKSTYANVIVGQVWGENLEVLQKCTAYNVDNWERLGMLDRWSESTRPTFDQRDRFRERELINKHIKKVSAPLILVSLAGGHTSRMQAGVGIKRMLMDEFSQTAQVVDLDAIKADRVYDAIGLLEIADALVTSDTVWLHLAADTNVPVASFLSQKGPWMQSETRCNCTLKLRDETDDSVNRLKAWVRARVEKTSKRRYLHVSETHTPVPKRVKRAQSSWKTVNQCGRWDIARMEDYPRDTRMLGEDRAIPFLRDALDYGLGKCSNDDYLVFTNDDTIITPDIVQELDILMSRTIAVASNRIDVSRWTGSRPDVVGIGHRGRDLFCFRARWLRMRMFEVPDYALGLCDWDTGMAAWTRWMSGSRWRWVGSESVDPNCELNPGFVLHESHDPTWATDTVIVSPGLRYNRQLVKKWGMEHDKGISQNLEWWDKV